MRIFHAANDRLDELPSLPAALPAKGYVWIGCSRREFEAGIGEIQSALQRWTGGQLVDLHISDLLNDQLPSHFDYTSWYDVLVFRRLAAGAGAGTKLADDTHGTIRGAREALDAIDTSPVGFAVFDRVLITVHPAECLVRDYIATRLGQMVQGSQEHPVNHAGLSRLPTSPADLMLRMVNYMVDSYLELRRLLTRQLGFLQNELFRPRSHFDNWQVLLESRNALHLLEDTCEDQRAAILEWIDALDEWPAEKSLQAAREHELLRVRSRDVLEHIERVLSHVRRLESSAETAVQMHFSAVGNRTNEIMRTLTVLTAVFLPLNLITGIFGMNFDALPLIHKTDGFWAAVVMMAIIGAGLLAFFWRKRYLASAPR